VSAHALRSPLIELRGVVRAYASGAGEVRALDGIDLTLAAGEMVAIVGASGSGKSTLLNILGCLDVPSSGHYRVAGVDTASLDANELAALRRERFGFVFQRYHLLPRQDALSNVEMPGLYAGWSQRTRRERALALLTQLGLADRVTHTPTALSGGQQQRVSIARALMNGGDIILADEPTGALDSRSGEATMALLRELNAQGHTVILVTHDPSVAAHAPRVVEMRDGRIVRDSGACAVAHEPPTASIKQTVSRRSAGQGALARLGDALRMAWDSLRAHRLRSALSILGISIGIAAVVSIVALGDATRQSLSDQLSALQSGRLLVYQDPSVLPPGAQPKDFAPDLPALSSLPAVASALPDYERSAATVQAERSTTLQAKGIRPGTLDSFGLRVVEGRDLSPLDEREGEQVVLLNTDARDRLFGVDAHPVGRTIGFAGLPLRVVGVVGKGHGANFDWGVRGYVTTELFRRKLGVNAPVMQVTVLRAPTATNGETLAQVEHVLAMRHGQRDFRVWNMDENFQELGRVLGVLQLILSAIAGISLLVGGVGVMNIMLVAVSERTQEIGIRMAVGARPSDVQLQFLIEAIVLCGVGGLVGAALPALLAMIGNQLQDTLHVGVSGGALAAALGVSSLIGVAFGYVPARQAARLSPVQALARE
jgi:macrolide transport system ATP-binding/permease protein